MDMKIVFAYFLLSFAFVLHNVTAQEPTPSITVSEQDSEPPRESLYQKAEQYRTGDGVVQNYEAAFRLYKESANLDYTPAIHALGGCYIKGLGTTINIEEGIRLLTVSANRGYIKSIHGLVSFYETGIPGYLQPDISKAKSWLKKGYELGDLVCMGSYGWYLLNPRFTPEPRVHEGLKLLSSAAEQGSSGAQYRLAVLYSHGLYVEQSDATAFYWYSLSAAQGNHEAQKELALCYNIGRGTVANHEKAVALFQKLALLGDIDCQYWLGCCLIEGRGISKDVEQGVEWLKKAEKNGHNLAGQLIREVQQDMEFVQKPFLEAN